jgi:hypothetical protein
VLGLFTCPACYTRPENLDAVKEFVPLTEAAEEMLIRNGFVVLGDVQYDRLSEVYFDLFQDETGVSTFITTDALLHIFHITYDDLLETAERVWLFQKVEELAGIMNTCVKSEYQALSAYPFLREAARRLWVVFGVGEALIKGETEISGDGIEPIEEEANEYLAKIYDHTVTEFYPGDDYTQYEPRGHYAGNETLEAYFRAVKWLSRRIFRIYDPNDVETSEYELASAAIMAFVLARTECGASALWTEIYNFTSMLVNHADSITPFMVDDAMIEVFGSDYDLSLLEGHGNLASLRDELLSEDYPESEIIPVPLRNPDDLPKKYVQFMGERYVMDGEAMQKTCFPHVPTRTLPMGLDVAATVFNSSAAYEELAEEMTLHPALRGQIDELKDQFGNLADAYWQKSTYNHWLYTLRALSERATGFAPLFMQTPLWEREKLNTMMASWAELRHDNILYAKETYIPMPWNEGYGIVEPYPAFYERLKEMCEQVVSVMEASDTDLPGHKRCFESMAGWAEKFGGYAAKMVNGEQLTDEEQTDIKGWGLSLLGFFGAGYPQLEEFVEEDDPELIADVASSSITFQVLHEAVGKLNPIVITYRQPGDGKALAAVGYVMSHYEIVEEEWNRLTDEEWKQRLQSNPPERPSWTAGYIYSPEPTTP